VREGYHATLRSHGLDASDLAGTAHHVAALSSTGGAGGVLDLYYEPWKLALVENPSIVAVMQALWKATWASPAATDTAIDPLGCGKNDFSHPYGPFDANKALAYVDRTCFRLPERFNSKEQPPLSLVADSADESTTPSTSGKKNKNSNKSKKKLKLQRSLTPHLDCCPHRLFESQASQGSLSKWKPIQAFIALTDTLMPQQGGFEVCKGMHVDFHAWATGRPPTSAGSAGEPPCRGAFTPIRPKDDQDILDRMEHIPVAAGDLCLWDYRLAHGNAWENTDSTAREAVYIGLLPYTDMNRRYAARQLQCFRAGVPPSDSGQWRESLQQNGEQQHHEQRQTKALYEFNGLGRKLMAIDEWE